ncbi:flagellar hook assembly protein FlgD [Chelativorans sp. YIM 93263]|uniref:flagellar hook assembly protein FlgD n=1 Tax=Chelativorans sp. YIM 93263 TaxID=2906648 RepID=UPI0023787B63|nr:flagellar hook assembly protein FlgD [Chelativorans sp. YIM 93263]
MDVSAVTQSTQNKSTAGSPQAVDYESFLKLLVAEMKNQDPTSPMESTDYVAQLAAFSQVEQSVQTNKKLDEILQASSLSQAGGLIGRQITSPDGSTSGIVAEVRLYSDGVVAILQNGEQVIVGPGVTVSEA